ncbi:hypothetical protein [Pseudarthrobacter sp. PS3-L1]|uniref:hypothetical protein n=1 Tax=Pseudarthrobacter sp. PS3-L1 TaxID=3046207 RepID=UPI0024BA00F2|nr:hypothetical protein [Pseudarthrobacter sp. PS3-L1]MDJ0321674.1 hypothetical protein [Pseudarthrobacter sp. PS3-L1]
MTNEKILDIANSLIDACAASRFSQEQVDNCERLAAEHARNRSEHEAEIVDLIDQLHILRYPATTSMPTPPAPQPAGDATGGETGESATDTKRDLHGPFQVGDVVVVRLSSSSLNKRVGEVIQIEGMLISVELKEVVTLATSATRLWFHPSSLELLVEEL